MIKKCLLIFTLLASNFTAYASEVPVGFVDDQLEQDKAGQIKGRMYFPSTQVVVEDEAKVIHEALNKGAALTQFKYHQHNDNYVICLIKSHFGDFKAFAESEFRAGSLSNYSVPRISTQDLMGKEIPNYDIGLVYTDDKNEKHHFWLRLISNVYVNIKKK